MERLLVATFQGDPEFEALEPQVFDDAVNGKGIRVLRYRKDGRVDVYWQPGVHVDRNTFTVGAGVHEFRETIIEPARFEIDKRALDLDVSFADARGRRVELRIHEDLDGKRGFPLLAPVGADIKEPKQLFLVFMPGIDLVRRVGSSVSIRIGDNLARPAGLPVLLGGHRVWFIRYAENPIIATLNPPASCPVLFQGPAPGTVEVEGMLVSLDRAGRAMRISCGNHPRTIEMDFLPGFPNLSGLPDGAAAEGRWTLRLEALCETASRQQCSAGGNGWEQDIPMPRSLTSRASPFDCRALQKLLS